MRKYKVKEFLKLLENDGWYLARTKGDHRQYKHLNENRHRDGKRKGKRGIGSILA